MKQIFIIGFCGLLLTHCSSGDKPNSDDKPNMQKKLSKDFWLAWWEKKNTQKITVGIKDAFDGYIVIDNVVFAVGSDDNFIIAKLHPDMQEEISKSLFGKHNSKGHFEIKNPSDTVYLNKADTIYQEENNWYHTSKDWAKPDSLKPYKKMTYYHIIDIRKYTKDNLFDSYKIYSFDNEKDFTNKRLELGVPEKLTFTIVDQELK
jgi:hypothetical protein